jgi:hypothetical protein
MSGAARDDTTFWDIADSPAFRRKWAGKVHPLIRQNGGVDFYNTRNLTQKLARAESAKVQLPQCGLSGFARQHSPAVLRDWLRQVEWIERTAL